MIDQSTDPIIKRQLTDGTHIELHRYLFNWRLMHVDNHSLELFDQY